MPATQLTSEEERIRFLNYLYEVFRVGFNRTIDPLEENFASHLHVCTVVDNVAFCNVYIVAPYGQSGTVPAVWMSADTGQAVLGAREISSINPGTRVLCLFPVGIDDYGIILGAVPEFVDDAALNLVESIVLRSEVGFYQDGHHRYLVESTPRNRKPIVPNASGFRPTDALPGDWGKINDLGVGVGIGRAMAWLKASDLAMLQAFFLDDLVKIVSYNYQHYTSGAEDLRYLDIDRYSEILRMSPFPWESLGSPLEDVPPVSGVEEQDGAFRVEAEDTCTLRPNTHFTKFEPALDAQMGIFRYARLRGYLGDLKQEIIGIPPTQFSHGLETYRNSENPYLGILEIRNGVDGSFSVRSAKAISLRKYALIPFPKQLNEPDSNQGDTNPEPEYERDDFSWDDNGPARSAQLWDYHAYMFNTYSKKPLANKPKDFQLQQEREAATNVQWNIAAMKALQKVQPLGRTFLSDLPNYATVRIDDRGESRYYQSSAGIDVLDDGTVIIEDGYGGEIVMGKGHIMMSCNGDIWLRPGRDVISMAPNDIILRAGNSLDATAGKGDLRLKADHNLHMMGGNSGQWGGVLIESRSQRALNSVAGFQENGEETRSYGILLKSSNAPIQISGHDMYMDARSGRMYVDAGTYHLSANYAYSISRSLRIDAVAAQGSETPIENMNYAYLSRAGWMTADAMTIGGDLLAIPKDPGTGGAIFGSSVYSMKNFITVEGRGQVIGPFPEEDRFSLEPFRGYLTRVTTIIRNIFATIDTSKQNAQTGIFNDSVKDKLTFSLRTEDDYKLKSDEFMIAASRCQQIFHATGTPQASAWEEPIVQGQEMPSMPYPGYNAWTSWSSYVTFDFYNVDLDDGRAKDRDNANRSSSPTYQILSEGYLVSTELA